MTRYNLSPRAADPIGTDYGSRMVRRRRVVALYAGFAAIFPTYALSAGSHEIVLKIAWIAITLIAFGFFAYGFSTLLQRTFINSANVPDDAVDERQLERRNRAVFVAYRALAVGVAVIPLWVLIASTASHMEFVHDPTLLAFASWSLLLVGITLPTAILAWTEPNPLRDDLHGEHT